MSPPRRTQLVVVIGDIHGRFHRMNEWVARLEEAAAHPVDLILSVGDVEAFADAEDHRRKAAKRMMPAEFAAYAHGEGKMPRPLYFIGGNNEDFEALEQMPEGGQLIENVHYLGRSGVTELLGIRIAYLSGIYAPKHIDTERVPPKTQQTRKAAGYFRAPEVAKLMQAKDVALLLVHEWPRGLLRHKTGAAAKGRALRAYRTPWIGNATTRELVNQIRPRWVLAGHSHVPFATTISHPDGRVTRIACLDQATRPDASLFWMEFNEGEAVKAGWGLSPKPVWRWGDPFTEALTPEDGEAGDAEAHDDDDAPDAE